MPSPESDEREHRMLGLGDDPRLFWLAVPIGVGLLALVATTGEETLNGRLTAVVIEDRVVSAMRWAPAMACVVLVALAAWRRRWFPHPLATIVFGFLGWLCTGVIGARALSDDVAAPDGSLYAFFHRTCFQHRFAMLGRVVDRGPFSRTIEVIEPDQGEFGFCFASIVRPAQAAQDRTRVVITPEGLVVGMIGPTACATARVGSRKSLSEAELENLSPFLLFRDAGEGVEEDVDAIVESLRFNRRVHGASSCREWAHPGVDEGNQLRSGTPTEASLLAALDHANPWVRAAARRIVEAGGMEMYPEATRRLATAPK
jgi:hypothetical protein